MNLPIFNKNSGISAAVRLRIILSGYPDQLFDLGADILLISEPTAEDDFQLVFTHHPDGVDELSDEGIVISLTLLRLVREGFGNLRHTAFDAALCIAGLPVLGQYIAERLDFIGHGSQPSLVFTHRVAGDALCHQLHGLCLQLGDTAFHLIRIQPALGILPQGAANIRRDKGRHRTAAASGVVDCLHNGGMEAVLIQCDRVPAVFGAVVQTADTAPHRLLFTAALGPHGPPVGSAAFTADEQLTEGVEAAVPALLGDACLGYLPFAPAPGAFLLDTVIKLPADDGRVVIFNQHLGQLAVIPLDLFANGIGDVGFLQEDVPAVAFVLQDGLDGAVGPFLIFGVRLHTVLRQRTGDGRHTFPGEVGGINPPNHFGLLRDNFRLSIRTFFVGVAFGVLEEYLALLHRHALAHFYIEGEGVELLLGKAGKDGQHHLAVFLQRVDVLFFKHYPDAHGFQLADVTDAVQRVSCKPADGLGNNEVNFTFFAVADHPHEIGALLCGGAGNPLVCVGARQCPLWRAHDEVGVVAFLCVKAGELFLKIRGNPAVGGHPHLAIFSPTEGQGFGGRYNNNFSLDVTHDLALLSQPQGAV